MKRTTSTIGDVAGLLVAVEFIRETTTRIEQAVLEQNGKLDGLCVDVAVLEEWRNSHVEGHAAQQNKQKKSDRLERIATAIGIAGAAFLGRVGDG